MYSFPRIAHDLSIHLFILTFSYLGLQGEENRRKLAETFKRPTTWGDYCQLVSINNCSTPDDVAQRAPIDAKEMDCMYMKGFYTGYFRYTDENNCTKNPTTCTGHIAE